jgi:uncharacterized protein YodC (DUF2158 family)
VEVKSVTFRDNPWLKVEVSKFNPNVTHYIVAYVDTQAGEVELLGWATREDVQSREPEKCAPGAYYPYNYIVKKLRDISTILPIEKTSQKAAIPFEGVVYEARKKMTTKVPSPKTPNEVFSSTIKAGDVVSLKSGSLPMTVEEVSGDKVFCLYFTEGHPVRLETSVVAIKVANGVAA